MPLVKKLCENTQSVQSDNNVICVIAQEFGKIVLGLESKTFYEFTLFYYRNRNSDIQLIF